jgi:alkylhydroperoxidase family enzyme
MSPLRARLQKMVDMIADADEGQRALRRAALARAATLAGGALPHKETLPQALVAYVEQVARAAWKVTDEDIAALRAAGYDEDTIYEITVATAVGAGVGRYQVAMRAIAAAKNAKPATGSG